MLSTAVSAAARKTLLCNLLGRAGRTGWPQEVLDTPEDFALRAMTKCKTIFPTHTSAQPSGERSGRPQEELDAPEDFALKRKARFCQHGEGGQPTRNMLTSAFWVPPFRLFVASDE